MLYDETAARDNVRNRDGKRVFYLGKQDRLTPSARDWLNRERIEILPAEAAKPQRYRILGGGYTEEKPEHMTHLNGDVLVPKTHPRIAFRGAVDTLEAELLLTMEAVPEDIRKDLRQILELSRLLIRCEVLEQPLEQTTLCGLTQQEQRKRSHFPQEYYGVPHFMPEFADGSAILRLNRCRTAARNAELTAVRAFTDGNGNVTRQDLLTALNRMSSMLYLLMIRLKGENTQKRVDK